MSRATEGFSATTATFVCGVIPLIEDTSYGCVEAGRFVRGWHAGRRLGQDGGVENLEVDVSWDRRKLRGQEVASCLITWFLALPFTLK